MIDARSAAAALRGDVIGRDSILAPGPGHSPKDRSLSVKLTVDGPLVFSHAGDDWRECKDHVERALGIVTPARQSSRQRKNAVLPKAEYIRELPASDLALRIWRETVPIAGTLAERYLHGRKLPLPDHDGAVRFHPRCPFGSDRLPCMVALYRDIVTNEPKAIHRTALTPDGQKIDRKALGPKRGCAIKLTPDEDVTDGLTIGEGIETTLAGIALGFRPAWAVGDAGEIARLPVLSGIECLTILVDHDPSGTGQKSAIECSRRWTAAGCEVLRVTPTIRGADAANLIEAA